MKRAILVTAATLSLAGCNQSHASDDAAAPIDARGPDGVIPVFPSCENPDWLVEMVTAMQEAEPGNPAWSVTEYAWNGMTVYYFPAQCCDLFSVLVDRCGEPICAPDGGITGRGDGACPDFHDTRSDERLIWEDPRGAGP